MWITIQEGNIYHVRRKSKKLQASFKFFFRSCGRKRMACTEQYFRGLPLRDEAAVEIICASPLGKAYKREFAAARKEAVKFRRRVNAKERRKRTHLKRAA